MQYDCVTGFRILGKGEESCGCQTKFVCIKYNHIVQRSEIRNCMTVNAETTSVTKLPWIPRHFGLHGKSIETVRKSCSCDVEGSEN